MRLLTIVLALPLLVACYTFKPARPSVGDVGRFRVRPEADSLVAEHPNGIREPIRSRAVFGRVVRYRSDSVVVEVIHSERQPRASGALLILPANTEAWERREGAPLRTALSVVLGLLAMIAVGGPGPD